VLTQRDSTSIAAATHTLEGLIHDCEITSSSDTEEKSTTAETHSTSEPLENPAMVHDVKHSGTGDNYIVHLSWGLYDIA
jgi:hypothetical protein